MVLKNRQTDYEEALSAKRTYERREPRPRAVHVRVNNEIRATDPEVRGGQADWRP